MATAMSATTVIVVAGAPRCGSSLLMRMLHRGGLGVVAGLGHVSYEDDRAQDIPLSAAFLRECQGQAVKVLDPHRHQLAHEFDYDILWIHRDPIEQARSMVKFLRACGARIVNGRAAVRAIARSIPEDYLAFQRLRPHLTHRVFELSFERLLTEPRTVAPRVAAFLGRDLDVDAMAGSVLVRTPRCLPGMLELDQL
jgi:hypothetical protein